MRTVVAVKRVPDTNTRVQIDAASTTIVGQFPAGDSQARVSDASGNVWEWTILWYDSDKIYRAVRGGSWSFDLRLARCACRSRGLTR